MKINKIEHIFNANHLLYLSFLSFFVYVLLNYQIILEFLGLKNFEETAYQALAEHSIDLLDFLDRTFFSPSFATFVLWSLCGLIIFTTLSSLNRGIKDTWFEIKTMFYVHPKTQSKYSFLKATLISSLESLAVFSLLILWSVFVFKVCIPFSGQASYYTFLSDDALEQRILSGLLSYVAIFLALLGFLVYFRLFSFRSEDKN